MVELPDIFFRRGLRVRAYRKLFLDEAGRLKPEAEAVLDDLHDFARFFKDVPLDPSALAITEGGRQVVRHILKNIGATSQELARHLKGEIYDK